MSEALQKALQLFLRGQDQDSVNHFFTLALCEEGEFASVDLLDGIARILDEETGDELRVVNFAITIEGK